MYLFCDQRKFLGAPEKTAYLIRVMDGGFILTSGLSIRSASEIAAAFGNQIVVALMTMILDTALS